MKSFAKIIYRLLRDIYLSYQFPRNGYSYFNGIFSTFEQAIQSAPQSKSIGYDNAELASEYRKQVEVDNSVSSFDYPVLFWLKSILDATPEKPISIFDFGGNVGTHFYAYQKYIHYPANMEWIVCDLPEIIKAGKDLSQTKLAPQLSFISDIKLVSSKDIFIASGSIQYIKDLSELLNAASRKPKHLLLNRLPLYDGKSFVTLQNGGKVFYPQHVFNQSDFINSLTDSDYELIDIWEDSLDSCIIPFHPQKSIKTYRGLYFRLKAEEK
jgi:putative methyltransferase (TIGR04325 family)